MEIKWITHQGIRVLALLVDDNDPYYICENCGNKSYAHPKLATKEDAEWCGDCNDAHFKKHMSEAEIGMWSIWQMQRNKAILIVKNSEESD